MASESSFTTSSPSTPEQLNPLVHLTNLPRAKPSCSHGNENVKPSGSTSSCNSRSKTKSDKQPAMWSNSSSPLPRNSKNVQNVAKT